MSNEAKTPSVQQYEKETGRLFQLHENAQAQAKEWNDKYDVEGEHRTRVRRRKDGFEAVLYKKLPVKADKQSK